MPVTTRKSNADAHPGHIVLETQKTKRTRQQIEEEEALARSEARAKKVQAAAKHRAVMQRIAQLEDDVSCAQKATRRHALRPDLHHGPPKL